METTTVTLTLKAKNNDNVVRIVTLPALPRVGDRLFFYELFQEELVPELNEATPLLVTGVDWILTNQKYRINLDLRIITDSEHSKS